MSVTGKTVVVVGAAGALGKALCRRFVEERAATVVAADIELEGAEAVARELSREGVSVVALAVDVADRASVGRLVENVLAQNGQLDVMINNVGVLGPAARVAEQSSTEWSRAVALNLMGTVHGIAAAVGPMREAGGGSIVNTGSVAGLTAWSHSSPYGATKAAVIHLTKVAALEYARDRIRINCVCPGAFESPMVAGLPSKAIATAQARHPLGIGSTSDLVGAYSYLAGDDSRWTTGAVLVVDGGYVLP